MSCKESRLLIAGLADDRVPEALAAHAETCPACAERLAWDARLRATLRSTAPVPTPAVLDRIRAEIASSGSLSLPRGRGWREGVRGFLKGKLRVGLALPLAAGAAALAVLATLPRPAEAVTPLSVFNRMGRAVVAVTGRLTPLDLRTVRRADGSTAQIVSVAGRAIEPGPDGVVSLERARGKTADVRASEAPAASPSNSEAPRRAAAKQIAEAPSAAGAPTKDSTEIDGKLADRARSKALERARGSEPTLRVDLDPAHYRSIAFGADRDHLVLVPKAPAGGRYVVEIDPRSGLPRSVHFQR